MDERLAMEKAEQEQRRLDRFWGLDFEVVRLSKEVRKMRDEEARSLRHRQLHDKLTLQLLWANEVKEQEDAEHRARARHDVQERRKYLDALYHGANASQAVVDYRWSSRPAVISSHQQQQRQPPHEPHLTFSPSAAPTVTTLLATRPRAAPESPSVHSGRAGGRAIDRQYFPEDDESDGDGGSDGRGPLVVAVPRSTFPASPKASQLLSKILEASNDLYAGSSASSNSDLTADHGNGIGRHHDSIWGHPEYGWNQLAMLENVFHKITAVSPFAYSQEAEDGKEETVLRLDGGGLSSLGAVLADAFHRLDAASRTQLSYTVLGSWAKKGSWTYFSDFFAPDAAFFTAADWLNVAATCAAHEVGVPPRKLRTNRDHCRTVETDAKRTKKQRGLVNQSSSEVVAPLGGGINDALFATAWRRQVDSKRREASLTRDVSVGDMVWCQHGHGFRWLPAVVKNITTAISIGGAGVAYDVSYIVSHDAFVVAHEDSLSAARDVAKVAAGVRPVREPADAEQQAALDFYAKMLHLEGTAAAPSDGAQLAARLAAAADELQQQPPRTSLQSMVLGSAALSALLLGTTLTSQAGTKTVVVLDKEDWGNALGHAHNASNDGGRVMECAASYVLDVAGFNTT